MKKQLKRRLLIALREGRGLRQADVAAALGLSTSRYGMYEVGIRTPRPAPMKAIADFFMRDMTELFPDAFVDGALDSEPAAVIAG